MSKQTDSNRKNDVNSTGRKMNTKNLTGRLAVFAVGLIMCIICASLTTYVNAGVGIGLLILIVGTVLFLTALYREIHYIGIETPFPLSVIFPSYPIVDDKDETGKAISGFRDAYAEFLSEKTVENSSLQGHASQLLWHCLFLQRKRLDKKGLVLKLESSRRAYTTKKDCIRSEKFFDGRYDVNDVSEEIDAIRSFCINDRVIKKVRDKEVAHYTFLSVKETEDKKVVCPNCGSISVRSNLVDGCDYCGTKFTVEDMNDSVSSFGFRRDFMVSESKRDVITELIYPWVFMLTEMPMIYFGFFGAFLYMDESIIARFITGLVAGGLFGLLGWCLVKLNMIIIVPIVYKFSSSWEKRNRNIVYRSKEVQEQEKNIAEFVRKYDPKFSLQNFFGGIQNKISAIHFADKKEQINAFSEVDLSAFLGGYESVVDVDTQSMTLCSYETKDGMQWAGVSAELLLRDYAGGKITERTEHIKMRLAKDIKCKTQSVCAPSILKCSSCGSSLSLMEGKKCAYCDHELDLKKYDWVITEYDRA